MGTDNVAALTTHYPDLAVCIIFEDPPWRVEDDPAPPTEIQTEWRQELDGYKTMPRKERHTPSQVMMERGYYATNQGEKNRCRGGGAQLAAARGVN